MRFKLAGLVLILAAFAYWHSGSRAGALCEREVFVTSGSLSLWPPGARCSFGLPAMDDTLVNPWFLATALAIATLAVLADALRSQRATR